MITLLTILLILLSRFLYKGEDYFVAKREQIMDEYESSYNEEDSDRIASEDDNRAFRKKLDRYWKCKRVCEECWPFAAIAAAILVITEAILLCSFIGTTPTRLEKKIEDCQIQNAAFESSIVEFLVHDAEANEDELSNEKIDLDKSFDYALIYLMRHPELKENKNFAKQVSFYQENYDKIQKYKSDLKFHDELRFLLYFGR